VSHATAKLFKLNLEELTFKLLKTKAE